MLLDLETTVITQVEVFEPKFKIGHTHTVYIYIFYNVACLIPVWPVWYIGTSYRIPC